MKNSFQILLIVLSIISFALAISMFYLDTMKGGVLIASGLTSLFAILFAISLKKDQKGN